MKPTITRREIVFVLVWALLVVVITTVPYLRAAQLAPPNHHFVGFIWGGDEGNVYLSWIRQAGEGRWLLRNPYTIKQQNPHFFNILLVVLGKICAITGLAPIIVFHGARLAGGIFLLYTFYLLVADLTENRRIRATALALVSVSSGLGWIVYLQVRASDNPLAAELSLHPMDVATGWQAQPEAITFLSTLLNPLFVISMGLLCLVFRYGLRAAREPGLRSTVACGLLLLVLGNVHTYDILIAYLTLLVWFVIAAARGRLSWPQAVGRYGLIVLLGIPAPLWGIYTAHIDPAYRAKVMENPTLSATPVDYAVGYGLVLLLAIVGAVYVIRAGRRRSGLGEKAPSSPDLLLFVVWAVLGFTLLYLPVAFQRKMIEGLHLPLCVLAAAGLTEVLSRVVQRWLSAPVFIVVVAIMTVPSNIFFVVDCLEHISVNNLDLLRYLVPPVYLTDDEMAALQWLRSNTSEADVILSSSLTGSHIPAYAPCTVVAGHWAETLQFRQALQLVGYFYSSGDNPVRQRQMLALTQARLVFYGPRERILQQGMASSASGVASAGLTDPGLSLPELEAVFAQGEVTIYRVTALRAGNGIP